MEPVSSPSTGGTDASSPQNPFTFEAVKNRVFFRDFNLPEKVLTNFYTYIIDANFAGFVHDYQI